MLLAPRRPANCIAIEAAPAPPDWPDRDKFPAEFLLDELRCIYCGMCEEACPVDAIELTHIYDMTYKSNDRGFLPGRHEPRRWTPSQIWVP